MRIAGQQRLLQFSLRTSFLLLTAACLWLGQISSRAREQRRSVLALKAVFAEIHYDCDTDSRQTSERHSGWIAADYQHSVVEVYLDAPAANDETMASLTGCPQLQTLSIGEGASVSNAGLMQLRSFPRLRRLFLQCGDIDDRGLACIGKRTELEELWIHNLPITDMGLQQLTSLKKLRLLSVDNTAVSEQGIARLQSRLPNCKIDYFGG